MAERGEVRAVAWMPMGSELSANVAIGALALVVDNPVDFDEDGGTVDLNGVQYDYTTVDMDTGTLTLATALTVAAVAGDRVNVWSGGQVAIDYVAFVSLGDGDELEVPIPYGDRDLWPEGEYATPVLVNLADNLEAMIGVPGRTPLRDGRFLDPNTLPPAVIPPSDGLPPANAPTGLTVIGGIGALFVRWTPVVNPDPVLYDLYVSPTTGFTADATTLVASTAGSSYTLRALVTPIGDPPDTALRYGTTYYAKVRARESIDGPGPLSGEASGAMVQITGPDVAADNITGTHIVGGTITGDLLSTSIVLGSKISTGALDANGNIVGARVELGPDGLTNYAADGHAVMKFPLDPGDDAFVEANFDMVSASVRDHFTMYGVNNGLAASSQLVLGAGVAAPTSPPNLTQTWDTVQLDTTTKLPSAGPPGSDYNLGTFNLDASQITSMCWDQVYGCWQVFQQRSNGFRLWRFNTDGTFFNNIGGSPWIDDFKNELHVTGCRGGWIQQFTDGNWYIWDTVIGGGRWGKVPASWLIGGSPADPFCAFDETGPSLMLCQLDTYTADTFQVRRVHTVPYVGGAIQNLVNDSTTTSPTTVQRSGAITGVYYGPADFGGNRYVTGSGNYTRMAVWLPGTRYNGAANFMEWETNGLAKAFAHDGTAFWSVNASGLMSKYTGWTWTTEPSTTWAGVTAYDSDPTGGTHETTIGTFANISAKRRAKLMITVPPTQDSGGPDDPDKWRVYWARLGGVTPPAATAMKFVAELGNAVTSTSTTIQADPTGAAPPTSNSFPAGNPAKILDGTGAVMADAQGHGYGGMPGEIRMYGGATAPTGWLLCDGSSVLRSAYPALFAVIGVTFGAGTNSPVGTTFSLPDMKSRHPWGPGFSGVLGQTEGGVMSGVANPSPDSQGRADRATHVHWHNAITSDGTLDTGTSGSGHTHNLGPGTTASNTATGGTAVRMTGGGDTGTTGSGHTHTISGHTATSSALSTGSSNVPSVHGYTIVNFIIRT